MLAAPVLNVVEDSLTTFETDADVTDIQKSDTTNKDIKVLKGKR